MDTRTVPDARAFRALALFRTRRAEIERTGPHTYLVPSCSGTGTWAVNYRRETCDCPDALRNPEISCKHVYAVGILRAKRRGGVATPKH